MEERTDWKLSLRNILTLPPKPLKKHGNMVRKFSQVSHSTAVLTLEELVVQTDGQLLSHWFLISSAHMPSLTASNGIEFGSPYSPDATSMTGTHTEHQRSV